MKNTGTQGIAESGTSLIKGMTRKCPPGDSGARPSGKSVADGATRDSVGRGHTLGGRTA